METQKGNDTIRANVYGLLAALLTGPPSTGLLGLLNRIEDQELPETEMARAWQMIKAAGNQADIDLLYDEFFDLFIGVGRGELVPYGSWYQSGLMMDRSLARLRSDLAELGICRKSGVQETEDHAAALCETMAILCSQTKEMGSEIQKVFFSRHLQGWMDRFFKDMQKASSAQFYRSVGRLGEVFLVLENDYMGLS